MMKLQEIEMAFSFRVRKPSNGKKYKACVKFRFQPIIGSTRQKGFVTLNKIKIFRKNGS